MSMVPGRRYVRPSTTALSLSRLLVSPAALEGSLCVQQGGCWVARAPQSSQSSPLAQSANSLPGPPSSHIPSDEKSAHLLVHAMPSQPEQLEEGTLAPPTRTSAWCQLASP
eukprot:5350947-Prymnesium_polylepis.1